MKKILMIIIPVSIMLGFICGLFIIKDKVKFTPDIEQADFSLSDNRKEIKPTNIVESGNYTYYVLPDEDDPVNNGVICRMKNDGTEKEILIENLRGPVHNNTSIYQYNDTLFYKSSDTNKINGRNLSKNSTKNYEFSDIVYLDNEIMIYDLEKGWGVVKMSDLEKKDFKAKSVVSFIDVKKNSYILYTDGSVIIYVSDGSVYAMTIKEAFTSKLAKLLVSEGEYTEFLLDDTGEIYYYVKKDNAINLYSFNKENSTNKLILSDYYEEKSGIPDNQRIEDFYVKNNEIYYSIGYYSGTLNVWNGSSRKVKKDGTEKEIIVANTEDAVLAKGLNNNILLENGNKKYLVEEENNVIILKELMGFEYKKVLELPKNNEFLDYTDFAIREYGNWIYIYIYETDYNVDNWRGVTHLEFYRVSKDYKTVQALDCEYVIKEPYSKLVYKNNIRINGGINSTVTVKFIPNDSIANLNYGKAVKGKYLIETYCQANKKSDRLELATVFDSNEKMNIDFDDYNLDGNPDFEFIRTDVNGNKIRKIYSIMTDGKIEEMVLANSEQLELPSLSKPETTNPEYSKIPENSNNKIWYENSEIKKYPNFDGEKVDLGEDWQDYRYSYSNEKNNRNSFYQATSRYLNVDGKYVTLSNKGKNEVIQLRAEETEYNMDYSTGILTLPKGTCYSVYWENDENNILEEGHAFDTNNSLQGKISLKKYYDEILRNNEKVLKIAFYTKGIFPMKNSYTTTIYVNYDKIKNPDSWKVTIKLKGETLKESGMYKIGEKVRIVINYSPTDIVNRSSSGFNYKNLNVTYEKDSIIVEFVMPDNDVSIRFF